MTKTGKRRLWNRTGYPNRVIRPVIRSLGFELEDVDHVTEVSDGRFRISFRGELTGVELSVITEDEEVERCS